MGLFTDGFKLLKKASEPLYKTPKSIQETTETASHKGDTCPYESSEKAVCINGATSGRFD